MNDVANECQVNTRSMTFWYQLNTGINLALLSININRTYAKDPQHKGPDWLVPEYVGEGVAQRLDLKFNLTPN